MLYLRENSSRVLNLSMAVEVYLETEYPYEDYYIWGKFPTREKAVELLHLKKSELLSEQVLYLSPHDIQGILLDGFTHLLHSRQGEIDPKTLEYCVKYYLDMVYRGYQETLWGYSLDLQYLVLDSLDNLGCQVYRDFIFQSMEQLYRARELRESLKSLCHRGALRDIRGKAFSITSRGKEELEQRRQEIQEQRTRKQQLWGGG